MGEERELGKGKVEGENAGAAGSGQRDLSAARSGDSRAYQPRGTGRSGRTSETLADIRRDSHQIWQPADRGRSRERARRPQRENWDNAGRTNPRAIQQPA